MVSCLAAVQLCRTWNRCVLRGSCRLLHLSPYFDDEHVGRLVELERCLSMVWSYAMDTDPDLWVHQAQHAMSWCTGTRAWLSSGHETTVEKLAGESGF